jgi:hypothetical protein
VVLHPDVVVIMQGLLGDERPDMNQFYDKISEVPATARVKWCLVGFQAWEYYKASFSLRSLGVSNLYLSNPLDYKRLHWGMWSLILRLRG